MRFSFLGPFGFHPNKTMRSRALPLAQELIKRGHAVQLVMPPWHTPEHAGRSWEEGGVQIVYVKLEGGTISIVRRMLITARRFSPDVIHGFKPKAYSGLAHWWLWYGRRFRPSKIKLFVDSDDWEGWGGWNDIGAYSPLQKRFFAWQERWGLTHNHLLTVASRALERKAHWLKHPAGKTLYLPNGPGIRVEDAALLHAVTTKRAELGLSNRPTVLLYSRLFEFDLERLIDVLLRVQIRIPDLAILSIGTGLFAEDQAGLRDRFARAGLLPAVVDLGWLEEDELPAALLAANVGLYLMNDTLLNRTKCPVKLADMIAVGLPVVGEMVGQVAEYVVSEQNGLLRPSGDAAGLADDLVALLQNPGRRAAMGHAGRERWQRHFDWAGLAEQYESAVFSLGA